MTNSYSVILTIIPAFISGMGVYIASSIVANKKEKVRKSERDHDLLMLELKDLQIKLYQLEKDLAEWKDKYYITIQELISVRFELEETLVKLNSAEFES
jgi:hypothetical protein